MRIAKLPIREIDLVTREFRATGYPEGWPTGDVASGVIVARVGERYRLRPKDHWSAIVAAALAAVSGRHPAGLIHRGYSGGPVEVDGRVVGLVMGGRPRLVDVTADMVPLSAEDMRRGHRRRQPVHRSPENRRWQLINGSKSFDSTRSTVEAWMACEQPGPLVFVDHFDSDVDVTLGELKELDVTAHWAGCDISPGRCSLENLLAPFSLVALESRFDDKAQDLDLADLTAQLRDCPGNVIVICGRALLRSAPLATTVRGLRWAVQAEPLYVRRKIEIRKSDVRDVPLALHLKANSPSLNALADEIGSAEEQKADAFKQLAIRALAADQLEASVRCEIALANLRAGGVSTHPVTGFAADSDRCAEKYLDLCDLDAHVHRADLIGPVGSGKSTVLRTIERQLVSSPKLNRFSHYALPVWMPFLVELDVSSVEFKRTLLEYMREKISSRIGSESASLRYLFGAADSLGDIAQLLSSPIMFLFDVTNFSEIALARSFIEEVQRDLPTAGYIVAHEDSDKPITGHAIRMSPPDLDTVKAILECSDDEIFSALCSPGDPARVLTNWSLLRMLKTARCNGNELLFDSLTLVLNYFEKILQDSALSDTNRREDFIAWLTAPSASPSFSPFESLAARLRLLPSSPGASGWVQALLMARRWRGLQPEAWGATVLEWLKHGPEAPTFFLRLLQVPEAARLLQEIARIEHVEALRLLNRLPRDLARELDETVGLSRSALFAARNAGAMQAASTSAALPAAIYRNLSWRDPRAALPPLTVRAAKSDGGPLVIGEYPVMRAQFEAFVRDGGYARSELWADDVFHRHARRSNLAAQRLWDLSTRGLPNAPMTDIALPEAAAFCAWLSSHSGDPYALPTAAEWDAAAGMDLRILQAASGDPLVITGKTGGAMTIQLNSKQSQLPPLDSPVGAGPPNIQGFYDMFGLIWEWCDSWAEEPHPSVRPSRMAGDPTINVCIRGCPRPAAASIFELLGASIAPGTSMPNLGFRVILIKS